MKTIYCKKSSLIFRNVDETVPEFELNEDFTFTPPLGFEFFPHLPFQHYDEDGECWVLDDESIDYRQLKAMTHLSALDIRRAMVKIGNIDRLDALFEQHPEFEREWVIAPGNIINLEDSIVSEALKLVDIDVDEIKRKILCLT